MGTKQPTGTGRKAEVEQIRIDVVAFRPINLLNPLIDSHPGEAPARYSWLSHTVMALDPETRGFRLITVGNRAS